MNGKIDTVQSTEQLRHAFIQSVGELVTTINQGDKVTRDDIARTATIRDALFKQLVKESSEKSAKEYLDQLPAVVIFNKVISYCDILSDPVMIDCDRFSESDDRDYSELSIDALPDIICDLFKNHSIAKRKKMLELFDRFINSGKNIRWPEKDKEIYEHLLRATSREKITKHIETRTQALRELPYKSRLTLDDVSEAIKEINDLLTNSQWSYFLSPNNQAVLEETNKLLQTLPKPFEACRIIRNFDKGWGFFNNIDGRMAPRFIRPAPLEYFRDTDIDQLFFSSHWRFDVLRPLYDGYSSYLMEFGLLFASVFLVPMIIIKMTGLLLHSDIDQVGGLLFWFLPAIIWAAAMTVISFTFSLLGLVTRPIMTVLLGTHDPELKLKIEGTFSESIEHRDKYLVSLKMTVSKAGHADQHLQDQSFFEDKKSVNTTREQIITNMIGYVAPYHNYYGNDKAILDKMSERAIFSR